MGLRSSLAAVAKQKPCRDQRVCKEGWLLLGLRMLDGRLRSVRWLTDGIKPVIVMLPQASSLRVSLDAFMLSLMLAHTHTRQFIQSLSRETRRF